MQKPTCQIISGRDLFYISICLFIVFNPITNYDASVEGTVDFIRDWMYVLMAVCIYCRCYGWRKLP